MPSLHAIEGTHEAASARVDSSKKAANWSDEQENREVEKLSRDVITSSLLPLTRAAEVFGITRGRFYRILDPDTSDAINLKHILRLRRSRDGMSIYRCLLSALKSIVDDEPSSEEDIAKVKARLDAATGKVSIGFLDMMEDSISEPWEARRELPNVALAERALAAYRRKLERIAGQDLETRRRKEP